MIILPLNKSEEEVAREYLPQIQKVFDIIKALPSQQVFSTMGELDDYLDQVTANAAWRWADLGVARQAWRPRTQPSRARMAAAA